MLTQLCPATRLAESLRRLQIPQEFFAAVAGTSTATLSKYLNGQWTSGDADVQWPRTMSVIESLIEKSKPLHLNFHPRHGESFKKIIHDFEKGQLLVSVIDLTPKSNVSDEIAKAATYLAEVTSKKI